MFSELLTNAQIGTWVNVGMLFLNAAVAIVTILSVNRSQKREVTFAFEPASKEEFQRHVAEQAESLKTLNAEITALRQEMRKDRDQLLLAGETRVSKLHERINIILETVSELRGRLSNH